MMARRRWLQVGLLSGLICCAPSARAGPRSFSLRWSDSLVQPPHADSAGARSYYSLRAAMVGLPTAASIRRGPVWTVAARDPTDSHERPGAEHREPAWLQLPGPSLVGHDAVYDPVRHRVIAIGGDSYPWYYNQDRVWVLSLKTRPA